MTREQKALAAAGSVVAVGLLFLVVWSVWIGLAVLVVGSATVVGVLRATHPLGARRPTVAALRSGPRPHARTDAERRAQQVQLEQRQAQALRRVEERAGQRQRTQAVRAERRAERESEARARAEREARERAEREARERAERKARERAEREARDAQRRRTEGALADPAAASDEGILAASRLAELPDAPAAQRDPKVELLDKVHARLRDYQ